MSDDSEIEQNVVTAVIAPGDILSEKPASVPEGHYVARLADSGVGSPSYVVVPLRDGLPVERIAIGHGERYYRTVTQTDEVLYRARGNEGTTAWTSSTE